MEVIEYVNEYKRMCHSRACDGCPLHIDSSVPKTRIECFYFNTTKNIENTVKYIEKWSNEHPIGRTCKFCKHYRTLHNKFGGTSGGCTVESGLITEVCTEDSCERFKRKADG